MSICKANLNENKRTKFKIHCDRRTERKSNIAYAVLCLKIIRGKRYRCKQTRGSLKSGKIKSDISLPANVYPARANCVV